MSERTSRRVLCNMAATFLRSLGRLGAIDPSLLGSCVTLLFAYECNPIERLGKEKVGRTNLSLFFVRVESRDNGQLVACLRNVSP